MERRRSASTMLERLRARDARDSPRSTPRPIRATAGTTTGARRRPLRRSSVDADLRARRRRARASRDASPRRRVDAGTTRCTSSAICAPTPRCCCACATGNSTSRRRAPSSPPYGFPLSWCFTRGRRAGVLDEPRSLPRRVGEPGVPPAPRRRPRLGARRGRVPWPSGADAPPSAPTGRPHGAQLLAVGLLAAAAGRDRAAGGRARSTTSSAASTRIASASATGSPTCWGSGPSRFRSTSRCSSATTRRVHARTRRVRQRGDDVGARVPARAARADRARARGARDPRARRRASRWCAASTAVATTCAPRSTSTTATTRHQLACRGYVVLAPDLRGFGERSDWNPPDRYRVRLEPRVGDDGRRRCRSRRTSGTCAARSTCSRSTRSSIRSASVPPASRTAGPATLFLAAIDERVKAAVVSGYFSSWAAAHRVPWNMCGSQVLPGILGRLEHVDLGALDRAPRAARRDAAPTI